MIEGEEKVLGQEGSAQFTLTIRTHSSKLGRSNPTTAGFPNRNADAFCSLRSDEIAGWIASMFPLTDQNPLRIITV